MGRFHAPRPASVRGELALSFSFRGRVSKKTPAGAGEGDTVLLPLRFRKTAMRRNFDSHEGNTAGCACHMACWQGHEAWCMRQDSKPEGPERAAVPSCWPLVAVAPASCLLPHVPLPPARCLLPAASCPCSMSQWPCSLPCCLHGLMRHKHSRGSQSTRMFPSPIITLAPPTRTAVIAPADLSTSTSRMLGRPISNPCSTTQRRVPSARVSRAAR
jgi:hypothetical protein